MIIDDYILIFLPISCFSILIWGKKFLSKFAFYVNLIFLIFYTVILSLNYYDSLVNGGGGYILWLGYLIIICCVHMIILLSLYIKVIKAKEFLRNKVCSLSIVTILLLFIVLSFLFFIVFFIG